MSDSVFEVKPIQILENNYIFVVVNKTEKTALAVDPGTSEELIQYLESFDLKLEALLITHHHGDHIEGIPKLVENYKNKIQIYAPSLNKFDIPQATQLLAGGELLNFFGLEWQVLALPGHTLGHIAYYNEKNGWLFSGDVLFGLGCGRIFEGSFKQQYESLAKIKLLAAETKVFCAHDYVKRNLEFCRILQKENKLPASLVSRHLDAYEENFNANRLSEKSSPPLTLGLEMLCNPFLTAGSLQQFTELRTLRNSF